MCIRDSVNTTGKVHWRKKADIFEDCRRALAEKHLDGEDLGMPPMQEFPVSPTAKAAEARKNASETAEAAFEAALAQTSEASRSRDAATKLHTWRARVFLRKTQVHMDKLSAEMKCLQPEVDSNIPHGLRKQCLQLWTEAQKMLTDYQVHLQQRLNLSLIHI